MHMSLSASAQANLLQSMLTNAGACMMQVSEGQLRLQSDSGTTAASHRSTRLPVPDALHWHPHRQGFGAIRAACALRYYAAA